MNMIDNRKESFLHSEFALCAVILLVTFLVRMPTLYWDFLNPDETWYATVGMRLIEGKRFYLDIVDHKPPLMYYLFALFVKITESGAIRFSHAVTIFIITATARIVAAIATVLGLPRKSSICAAFFYVLATSCGKPSDVGATNAELVSALPMALQGLVFVNAFKCSGRYYFCMMAASGFMGAVAILIKLHAVLPIIACVVYLFFCKESVTRMIIAFTAMVVGALVPFGMCALWLYSQGLLALAWYWAFTFNSIYMKGYAQETYFLVRCLKQCSGMFLGMQGWLWIPLIVALSLRESRMRFVQTRPVWIIMMLLASTTAIFLGGYFSGHYFLQPLPILSVATSAAIFALSPIWQRRKVLIVVWAIMITSSLLVSIVWMLRFERFNPKLESVENRELLSFLRKNTKAGERIEVWGHFNGIPYLVGRENGSRFVNKKLLTGAFRREYLLPIPKEHWTWFFEDLDRNAPEWFIDHSAVDMPNAPLSKFPQLANYISSHYKYWAEIGDDIIYYRKAAR